MCSPTTSNNKLPFACKQEQSTPTFCPATEALNQQLLLNHSIKRRKLGDDSGIHCRHPSLPDLNMPPPPNYVYDSLQFPPINSCLVVSIDDDDYENSDGTAPMDFREGEESVGLVSPSHLGKRCRGVVRSQTIPSCMCLLDAR